MAVRKIKANANTLKVVGVSKERKQLFDAIMNNLRPLYTVDGNVLTKVGDIPLDLLVIDKSYQGYRVHNKIQSLIMNWDYRKLDLITVVPHFDTCTFSVVDGQGRTMAARELELGSLCAKVLMDAPENPEERLRYEAQIFVQQDEQLEKLRAVEKHLALTLMDDPTALAMNKVMKKYHVEFVDVSGKRSGRVLGSYPQAFGIVKSYGEDALEYIFSVIENAGWGDATNGYSTDIVWGLRSVWSAHEDIREISHRYLSTVLRDYDPITIKAKVIAKYPARDRRQAMGVYLEDLLIDAHLIEQRTYKDSLKWGER